MRVLEDLGALLPAGTQRNEVLLQAVEISATAALRTLAPDGERVARLLEQSAGATPLSEDQRQRLHAAREKLERLLRPPG
jgi:hypothetical protein